MAEKMNDESLSTMFDKLWALYTYIKGTDEPTVSDKFQNKAREGLEICENAVHMVNNLRLFSDNEELEEVATSEIRFLLLPALMGHFTCTITKGERIDNIKKAQIYYRDYLRLCKNYGLTNIELPKLEEDSDSSGETATASASHPPRRAPPSADEMAAMAKQRQAKIERFKQQKETEQHLQELYKQVQKEHVDEDVKREYFTTLLRKWINTSIEEGESIQQEIPILEHMAKMRKQGGAAALPSKQPPQQNRRPPQNFIITKSDLQKKVFGLGYPSIPTYTLDEFFDQQMAAGNIPQPGSMPKPPESERAVVEKAEAEKEEKIEKDDEETLQKAREFDDFKDDHRRGWGNTQNKG